MWTRWNGYVIGWKMKLRKADFDGIGYPIISSEKVVILSRGKFLYGTPTYLLPRQNMLVVLTYWHRQRGTIIKRNVERKYLKNWERLSPPRKMLAVEGRVVNVAPPE